MLRYYYIHIFWDCSTMKHEYINIACVCTSLSMYVLSILLLHISVVYYVEINFYNNVKLMSCEFGIGDNYVSKLRFSHIIAKLRDISTLHI